MTDTQHEWAAYVVAEGMRVEPWLKERGFELDDYQPQTIGERYLTRPIGGGRKVVFFGRRISDGMRVVVKTSNEPKGADELEWEHRVRELLERIKFAYQIFYSPAELFFDRHNGILITEFIDQDKPYLERPIEEQFSIALKAFKAQESAHATTAAHRSTEVAELLKEMQAKDYYAKATEYCEAAGHAPALDKALEFIKNNLKTLDQYGGFLTHWDFIPQNFRIQGGKLYLLDHTSIRLGNKYEGWARFINFMELYNPPLVRALVHYVRDNRTPEESLSLKVMRAYRLIELIRYYAASLSKTTGSVHELSKARISFWTSVLEAVLDDKEISPAIVEAYKKTRDALRSEEEKQRQIGLH